MGDPEVFFFHPLLPVQEQVQIQGAGPLEHGSDPPQPPLGSQKTAEESRGRKIGFNGGDGIQERALDDFSHRFRLIKGRDQKDRLSEETQAFLEVSLPVPHVRPQRENRLQSLSPSKTASA